MVGVLSNRVGREALAAGDHIYSWRTAYIYAHHGIYAGDGMVIHFTRAVGHEIGTGTFLDKFLFSSSPTTADGPPCEKCGHLIKPQGVIMSCLDCFLDGGSLYLFDYAVSPPFFLAKARGGTCTMALSDAAQLVVHRAKHLLNNGFGMYSLFKNNCEDFAIYCKTELLVETAYSVGRSGQLASLTAAFSAVASSPLRFLTTSASGLAIVTSGMYCVGRYVSDMGVRRDVIKVPVERLVEHWVNNVTPALPQGATQAETATPGGLPELPEEGELAKTATPGGSLELPGESELAKTECYGEDSPCCSLHRTNCGYFLSSVITPELP
uniref:LRAT domain-containing protein n=1 Tax=Triticum urartu TaxID=4572 RepID=A0A8R7QCR1_TRIUA